MVVKKVDAPEPDVDEDVDEVDTGAEDDGTDDQDQDEDEYKAPTKEEWTKVQRALKRARTDARKLRETVAATDTSKDDVAAQKEEIINWQQRAIRSEAKSLFQVAGAKPDKVNRLVKMLDLADIDLTGKDDDITDSLQEQIDEIKEDFGELFGTVTPPTRRPGSVDQGAGASSNGKRPEKSFGQKLVEQGYAAAGRRPPRR